MDWRSREEARRREPAGCLVVAGPAAGDDQADSIMTSVIDAFEPDDVIAQASSYGLFCPHILLRTTSNLLHINYDQLALTYCTAPWKTRKGIQTLLVTIALLSNSLS